MSYYSAIKLGASDYFNSRGVLYNNGTGNKKSNAEGYSKFGQRNVKLNYTLSGAQLNARWGWQMLKIMALFQRQTGFLQQHIPA